MRTVSAVWVAAGVSLALSVAHVAGQWGRLNTEEQTALQVFCQRYDLTTNDLTIDRVAIGNRLGIGGPETDWVSLDRWFIVGPFAAPRTNLMGTVFPPERGINLDGVYEDVGGVKRKWKYRRFGTDFLEGGVRLEPYVVDMTDWSDWYFYTEFVADNDGEIAASFAADDFGRVWINGAVVFESGQRAMPWRPFLPCGLQTVTVRKGLNTVLFKLGNAQGTTGFSAILRNSPGTVQSAPSREPPMSTTNTIDIVVQKNTVLARTGRSGDAKVVTRQELIALLRGAPRSEEAAVSILADPELEYGKIVLCMDALELYGFRHIRFDGGARPSYSFLLMSKLIPRHAFTEGRRWSAAVITLTPGGDRFLRDGRKNHNQAPVQDDYLKHWFGERKTGNGGEELIVAIDIRTSLRVMASLFAMLEEAGLRRVSIVSTHSARDEGQ